MMDNLRQEIGRFLGFTTSDSSVTFETNEIVQEDGYRRLRIQYPSQDEDNIPAFFLLPDRSEPIPAVLMHHQHNSERHLGKSEVCGLIGDPLQAFGPILARQGIAVLAPDSICFEDRRKNRSGTVADSEGDVAQHYNEMCYRLLRGDTLMRKVLSDSAHGISLLQSYPQIDSNRIGIMGHSYGGNTVLFHAALDERIQFSCSSGAACSYQYKMAHQLGIEMAEVIPGFASRYDIADLLTCFAPRPILLVSATSDNNAKDAHQIAQIAKEKCAAVGVVEKIEHKRYQGKHALTQERFDDITDWLINCAM